ncbi:hypothetical protein PVAG01_10676 [Phlyctema vagabunda]|uniref:MARVEL domain-containing protein n=1 Tax=Phlyctema vagabunda TaxID=108571 RepID=A0ABR4P3L2_9HELO
MPLGLLLPLRIAQAICALVVLILSAYVAHWYDVDTLATSPSQVNFLIFVPAFSFIALLYLELTPRFMAKASHPYAHIALETVNTLFYFAGFIALSAFLGKLLFCRGSVCSAARVDAVFAAFGFMAWAGTTTLLALEMFKGGFRSAAQDQKAKMAMKETVNPNNV